MRIYIDLSNLMAAQFLTGIQRVVRETTIRLLEEDKNDISLISYSSEKDSFVLLSKKRFIEHFTYNRCPREAVITNRRIDYTKIAPGSVFFDMDNVWRSRHRRSFMYPILKQRRVKIVTLLHDLIPLTHPQFSHRHTVLNFIPYIGAALKYSDLIITAAEATRGALNKLTDELKLERKNCTVISLGSDFSKNAADKKTNKSADPKALKLASEKYILTVGTIEPRKNHKLLLDALDAGLTDETGVKVIIAGRIGWNVRELKNRMENHPLYGKSLLFFEYPNDITVDFLYKNAFAVAFPTFIEGFGLPVIEALEHKIPVIASDIEVLHEIAGGYADYFDPNDPYDFIKCVKRLTDNPSEYEKKKEKLKNYVPPTWDNTAREIIKELDRLKPQARALPPHRQ